MIYMKPILYLISLLLCLSTLSLAKETELGEIDDALVHGDFRLGNIIVGQDGLQ